LTTSLTSNDDDDDADADSCDNNTTDKETNHHYSIEMKNLKDCGAWVKATTFPFYSLDRKIKIL